MSVATITAIANPVCDLCKLPIVEGARSSMDLGPVEIRSGVWQHDECFFYDPEHNATVGSQCSECKEIRFQTWRVFGNKCMRCICAAINK